jgi:hypothetical protein
MHVPANGAFFLSLRASVRLGKLRRTFLLPARDQRRPLGAHFLAEPVNLDNTLDSVGIVLCRWLGWRTRAETTPRFVLKRGAQRLSKDSFPGPLMTQIRRNFSGGLC